MTNLPTLQLCCSLFLLVIRYPVPYLDTITQWPNDTKIIFFWGLPYAVFIFYNNNIMKKNMNIFCAYNMGSLPKIKQSRFLYIIFLIPLLQWRLQIQSTMCLLKRFPQLPVQCGIYKMVLIKRVCTEGTVFMTPTGLVFNNLKQNGGEKEIIF